MDSTLYISASYADRSGHANEASQSVSAAFSIDSSYTDFAPYTSASLYISGSLVTVSSFVISHYTGSITVSASNGVTFPSGGFVDNFTASLGSAAKWVVSVSDGTNFRGSKILSSWNRFTGQIDYSERGVNQLGSVPVTLSAVYQSGGIVSLQAIPTVGIWSIKVVRMVI